LAGNAKLGSTAMPIRIAALTETERKDFMIPRSQPIVLPSLLTTLAQPGDTGEKSPGTE